jgi:hypothetical protein
MDVTPDSVLPLNRHTACAGKPRSIHGKVPLSIDKVFTYAIHQPIDQYGAGHQVSLNSRHDARESAIDSRIVIPANAG